MYFLWYFIRQNKTVVYESVECKRVWVFSPIGCRSFAGIADTDSCQELFDRATYFLFDATGGNKCHEPVKCQSFLLLFSCPNINSYKQVLRGNVTKVGFTSPSYEELLLLGKALNMEEKDIHRKFLKYGPDVSSVITGFERDADISIKKAIDKFNISNLSSYIDGMHKGDGHNISVLFKTTAREEEFDTLEDAYSCDNIQWEFASADIFEKVLDNYEESSNVF
jgi:hypothetical protein